MIIGGVVMAFNAIEIDGTETKTAMIVGKKYPSSDATID